jgi:hypothetical protein
MATRARCPLEVVERETGGIQRANEIRRKVFAGFRAGGTRLPNEVRVSFIDIDTTDRVDSSSWPVEVLNCPGTVVR